MRCVLIVDSDSRAREAIRRSLERRYATTSVATKEQACRALSQQVVDLIVLEARLPDGSGLELLAQVRANYPKLPAVMVTGHGSENVCASAFKLGVRDYLKKPITRRALFDAVEKIIPAQSDPTPFITVAQSSANAPGPGLSLSQQDKQRIQEAAVFIRNNSSEALTLDDIARAVSMGRFTFSRKFTAVMGVSFRCYLLGIRVRHAATLLSTTLYPIIDVAQLVGFRDLSRFNSRRGGAPVSRRALA